MIAIGSEAPDFELPSNLDENGRPGKKIRLSDFRGKKNVVLAFYPLDFSPVCSKEVACFREDLSALAGAGAELLGVSVDSVWTHAAFARDSKLTFPLLADFHPKGKMADSYGLYHADTGITARATVIVDKSGKVAYAEETPIGETRNNEEILAALKTLS